MISVRQLLNSPSLVNANIVAGNAGVDRSVSKFGVLDAPDSTNFAGPGEFIVTSGYLFENNEALQLEVITRLIEIKAAAWALKFDRYNVVLSEDVYALANEHRFPIIALPKEVTWYEIAKIIISEGNEISAPSTSVFSIVDNFLHTARGLLDLAELPSMLYDFFGYPCATYSGYSHVQKSFPEGSFNSTTLLDVLMAYEQQRSKINNEGLNIRHANIEYIVKELRINNKYHSHIIIQNRVPNAMFPSDVADAIKFILMAAQFRCDEFIDNAQSDFFARNLFVLNLLQKHMTPNELAASKAVASEYKINLVDEYVVIVVEVELPDASGDSQSSSHNFDRIVQYISTFTDKNAVIAGWINIHTFFFLVPWDDISDFALSRIASGYAGHIRIALNAAANSIITAISPPCSLGELNIGFTRAQRTISVAKKFNMDGNVFFYKDLELCNLFYETNLLKVLIPYYQKHILPLEKYDAQKNSEFVRTLACYVNNNYSLRSTAKELITHHNTVRYRLSIIQRITKLDLSRRMDWIMLELCMIARPLIIDSMKEAGSNDTSRNIFL